MDTFSRRRFIVDGSSCLAHLALAGALAPLAAQRLWAQARGAVVATEPFGRLEQVADGVWALVSTPLGGSYVTVSNGGLIAGRSGLLAIEGLMTPDGARWLATKGRELTGKWPTHVVLTHYHSDHTNGVAGYRDGALQPAVYTTPVTRGDVLGKNLPADPARTEALANVVALEQDATTIDLGGRSVTLTRRRGHTASDVTVEVSDPSIVFGGDLLWNGMFPNFVDAVPTALTNATKALRRERLTTYIPGHGAVASDADVGRYLSMLGEVEAAARQAHQRGTPAADAGAAFTLSPALGEWALFNKVFFQRAFEAWNRELAGAR